MSLISRRYADANNPPPAWDATYVPPAEAAKVRVLLRRMIHARDHGCDFDGTPYRTGGVARDYLLACINEAERVLRPHAAGLLR